MASSSRVKTMTLPNVTSKPVLPGKGNPTVEDQIRKYRDLSRTRFELQQKYNKWRGKGTDTLEQYIDPEEQLKLSMRDRAAIAPAEVLYQSRRDEKMHRVYMHRSEETILCLDDQQLDMPFITNQSFEALRKAKLKLIHVGVVQVRLQVLHRMRQGTMAHVVLRDTRFKGDQSIFASMEVDLTKGVQMVYMVPDVLMTIQDFADHMELSIQTRGYENMQDAEANLLITKGLIGRLTNTSNAAFAYKVGNVTDYLATNGIHAIEGKAKSTEEIQGQNWIIKPSTRKVKPKKPTSAHTKSLPDGSVSMRYSDYVAAPVPEPIQYDRNDDEEILVEQVNMVRQIPQRRRCTVCQKKVCVCTRCGIKKEPRSNWDTLEGDVYPDIYDCRYAVKYNGPANWRSFDEERSEIIASGWEDEVIDDDTPCHIQVLGNPDDPDDDDAAQLAEMIRLGFNPTYQGDPDLEFDYPQRQKHVSEFTPHKPLSVHMLTEGGDNQSIQNFHDCNSDLDGVHMMTEEEQTEEESEEEPARVFKVQKLDPLALLPRRCSPEAAGYDLSSIATYIIPRKERIRCSTGIALQIPSGFYGQIKSRSSLAMKGIDVVGGVIDPDYRGEILVILANNGRKSYKIHMGDRIAQILFIPCVSLDFEETTRLKETQRGSRGFGSTSQASEPLSEQMIAMMETDYPKRSMLEQFIHQEDEKPKVMMSTASQSAISQYRPPEDTSMEPPGYFPATGQGAIRIDPGSRPSFTNGGYRGGQFKRQTFNEFYNLPSAMMNQGAVLVFPNQIEKFEEVFVRWESITLNLIANQNFADNAAKVFCIENLLGEMEKDMWIQWRTAYPTEYAELVASADGHAGTQNVINQIRTIFTLEDPRKASTLVQEEAYKQLERLSCKNISDIVSYLNDFLRLSVKTGRVFVRAEMAEKFWSKMPGDLGKRIQAGFDARHPGAEAGIGPRVYYAFKYLQEECANAAFARSLKNLSFCKEIPIPGYYKDPEKKYGIRKSTTYHGKPHASHVRVDRKKYLDKTKTCKCFLCGDLGHYARDCKKKVKDVTRVHMYENMSIPEEHEVLSVGMDEEDRDAIYSVSEGIEENCFMEDVFMIREVTTPAEVLIGKGGSYRPLKKVSRRVGYCTHNWEHCQPIPATMKNECITCHYETQERARIYCRKCQALCCNLCSVFYFDVSITVRPIHTEYNVNPLVNQQHEYIAYLTTENTKLREEAKYYKEQYERLFMQISLEDDRVTLAKQDEQKNKKKELDFVPEEEDEDLGDAEDNPVFSQEQYDASASINTIVETTKVVNAVERPITKNRLYNVEVELQISEVKPFSVKAIIDTGATTCLIDEKIVPKEAMDKLNYTIDFNSINSMTKSNLRLKDGKMFLGEQWFRIPFTYILPFQSSERVQMIIGCNFIRSMHGGLRIEGDQVTIYKNVTTIQTQQMINLVECSRTDEETFEEDVYYDLSEWIFFEVSPPVYDFKNTMEELKRLAIFGNDPMKYWMQNQIKCTLDLKNPDLTIDDKPWKHITPALRESFQKHVDELLDLKVIRPSKSRHRTCAFMVQSGTYVDPITKEEKKGKERMVCNYKRLNDNTHKDQYSLPGIDTIVARIGHSQIYSKFDLKSGFHQVAMDPSSIEWTAFWTPVGLYEWLVMPFGLKNAPAVFQRKMDQIFNPYSEFIAVYIDDILVFSPTAADHRKHLAQFAQICQKHGLVLSPTKMKVAQAQIDFLGSTITNGGIKMQPHIIQKLVDFDEEKLKTTNGLRSWLGLLNYARLYLKDIGKILGPLYSKVSPNGERRMNVEDWKIVHRVKEMVNKLPALAIPPPNCSIIIESDGCMEGWGAVCKWKKGSSDPISTEKVCAYASGKYNPIKSTIDAEVYACINALESFKIFYLDKRSIVLRTDCQAIVSFINKTVENKPSRSRWLTLRDYVTGLGIEVSFEHISGKDNLLADTLSRLVMAIIDSPTWSQPERDSHEAKFLQLVEDSLQEPHTTKLKELLTKGISIIEGKQFVHMYHGGYRPFDNGDSGTESGNDSQRDDPDDSESDVNPNQQHQFSDGEFDFSEIQALLADLNLIGNPFIDPNRYPHAVEYQDQLRHYFHRLHGEDDHHEVTGRFLGNEEQAIRNELTTIEARARDQLYHALEQYKIIQRQKIRGLQCLETPDNHAHDILPTLQHQCATAFPAIDDAMDIFTLMHF
nr:polyprotein [Camellia sinensis badnavirus]